MGIHGNRHQTSSRGKLFHISHHSRAALTSVVGQHPRRLELRRLYDGRLTPVKINAADQAALRLPLLPEDHIIWN